MKTELYDYDVYPKVFLAGKPVTITIKPLGAHVAFEQKQKIQIVSAVHGSINTYPERNNAKEMEIEVSVDGCLRLNYIFPEECEYFLRMKRGEKRVNLSVYALAEDMEGRYPYRGDLHMHTCRSDGKQAPAIVAADYRRHGYDFTVISDHERYYPSLEALEAYKDVPIEMNIVVGEEVHLPYNDVHIVNFGGKYSINGLIDQSAQNRESDKRAVIDNPPSVLSVDEYKKQVTKLQETLEIPDGIETFTYASCVWIFEQIRKAEGLGIYAHPYWKSDSSYQVPESLDEYITKTHPFDAFEVLGGESYYQQNGFQTIRYYEDRAKGIKYPIVGSTDSHNSIREDNRNALICSTFVFAKENTREDLIAAIKEEYSVAVDSISKEYRLVGDLRLVKYVRFLLDEFIPLHDELCFEEGRLMKAYATGDEEAKKYLQIVYGRMKKLYQKYFAV